MIFPESLLIDVVSIIRISSPSSFSPSIDLLELLLHICKRSCFFNNDHNDREASDKVLSFDDTSTVSTVQLYLPPPQFLSSLMAAAQRFAFNSFPHNGQSVPSFLPSSISITLDASPLHNAFVDCLLTSSGNGQFVEEQCGSEMSLLTILKNEFVTNSLLKSPLENVNSTKLHTLSSAVSPAAVAAHSSLLCMSGFLKLCCRIDAVASVVESYQSLLFLGCQNCKHQFYLSREEYIIFVSTGIYSRHNPKESIYQFTSAYLSSLFWASGPVSDMPSLPVTCLRCCEVTAFVLGDSWKTRQRIHVKVLEQLMPETKGATGYQSGVNQQTITTNTSNVPWMSDVPPAMHIAPITAMGPPTPLDDVVKWLSVSSEINPLYNHRDALLEVRSTEILPRIIPALLVLDKSTPEQTPLVPGQIVELIGYFTPIPPSLPEGTDAHSGHVLVIESISPPDRVISNLILSTDTANSTPVEHNSHERQYLPTERRFYDQLFKPINTTRLPIGAKSFYFTSTVDFANIPSPMVLRSLQTHASSCTEGTLHYQGLRGLISFFTSIGDLQSPSIARLRSQFSDLCNRLTSRTPVNAFKQGELLLFSGTTLDGDCRPRKALKALVSGLSPKVIGQSLPKVAILLLLTRTLLSSPADGSSSSFTKLVQQRSRFVGEFKYCRTSKEPSDRHKCDGEAPTPQPFRLLLVGEGKSGKSELLSDVERFIHAMFTDELIGRYDADNPISVSLELESPHRYHGLFTSISTTEIDPPSIIFQPVSGTSILAKFDYKSQDIEELKCGTMNESYHVYRNGHPWLCSVKGSDRLPSVILRGISKKQSLNSHLSPTLLPIYSTACTLDFSLVTDFQMYSATRTVGRPLVLADSIHLLPSGQVSEMLYGCSGTSLPALPIDPNMIGIQKSCATFISDPTVKWRGLIYDEKSVRGNKGTPYLAHSYNPKPSRGPICFIATTTPEKIWKYISQFELVAQLESNLGETYNKLLSSSVVHQHSNSIAASLANSTDRFRHESRQRKVRVPSKDSLKSGSMEELRVNDNRRGSTPLMGKNNSHNGYSSMVFGGRCNSLDRPSHISPETIPPSPFFLKRADESHNVSTRVPGTLLGDDDALPLPLIEDLDCFEAEKPQELRQDGSAAILGAKRLLTAVTNQALYDYLGLNIASSHPEVLNTITVFMDEFAKEAAVTGRSQSSFHCSFRISVNEIIHQDLIDATTDALERICYPYFTKDVPISSHISQCVELIITRARIDMCGCWAVAIEVESDPYTQCPNPGITPHKEQTVILNTIHPLHISDALETYSFLLQTQHMYAYPNTSFATSISISKSADRGIAPQGLSSNTPLSQCSDIGAKRCRPDRIIGGKCSIVSNPKRLSKKAFALAFMGELRIFSSKGNRTISSSGAAYPAGVSDPSQVSYEQLNYIYSNMLRRHEMINGDDSTVKSPLDELLGVLQNEGFLLIAGRGMYRVVL